MARQTLSLHRTSSLTCKRAGNQSSPRLLHLATGVSEGKECNNNGRKGGGSQFCKPVSLCVMYGRSDQRLGGISWGKGSSSHFGIKPDQTPGELMKVNDCQKGLDHLGLFRMPVGLLAFSGYAN